MTQFFPSENTYRQLDVGMPTTIGSYIYHTRHQVLFENGDFLNGDKYLTNVFIITYIIIHWKLIISPTIDVLLLEFTCD